MEAVVLLVPFLEHFSNVIRLKKLFFISVTLILQAISTVQALELLIMN